MLGQPTRQHCYPQLTQPSPCEKVQSIPPAGCCSPALMLLNSLGETLLQLLEGLNRNLAGGAAGAADTPGHLGWHLSVFPCTQVTNHGVLLVLPATQG